MIGEALDTLITVGWALLAWIALTSAVAALGLWTLMLAVAWPWAVAWRAVSGAVAASRALRALGEGRGSHGRSGAHTGPRVPVDTPSAATGTRWSAPQTPGGGFPVPPNSSPPRTHSAPSWARTKDAA